MSARIRIKICGLTTEEDARAAIEDGADALGFNLFQGSPRHVDIEHAAAWIVQLPPMVTRVAVLVNAPLAEAQCVARLPAIDLVQLHGDEDAAYCAALAASGLPFIKALRVRDAASIEGADRFSTPYLLLDAHSDSAYGGTGLRFDPTIAREAVRRYPQMQIILAGGLRPENVADAVRTAVPYAVDVASGVEQSPGKKDRAKVAAFVAAVTSAR